MALNAGTAPWAGGVARDPAPRRWPGRVWNVERGRWQVAGPRPEESSFRPLSSEAPGPGQGGISWFLGVCWGQVGGKAGNSGLEAEPQGAVPGLGTVPGRGRRAEDAGQRTLGRGRGAIPGLALLPVASSVGKNSLWIKLRIRR